MPRRAAVPPPAAGLVRRALMLPADIARRLSFGAVEYNVSESAITEVALREFLSRKPVDVQAALDKHGARRRRAT